MTGIILEKYSELKEGFEVVYPKDKHLGLTPELLKSLWDKVMDDGWAINKQTFIYKNRQIIIRIFINVIDEIVFLRVLRPGAFPSYELCRLRNNIALYWNKNLSVKEVKQEMNISDNIDEIANKVNDQECTEKALVKVPDKKISVDVFFQPKSKCILLPPDIDGEQFLEEFNQSNRLKILYLRQTNSYKIICLELEMETIGSDIDHKLEYLKNNGLAPEDTSVLSDEEFVNLITQKV